MLTRRFNCCGRVKKGGQKDWGQKNETLRPGIPFSFVIFLSIIFLSTRRLLLFLDSQEFCFEAQGRYL